jgi:hypothetical protein
MFKRFYLVLLLLYLSLQGCNYPGNIGANPTEPGHDDTTNAPTPTTDPSMPGGGGVDPASLCEPNEGLSSAPPIGNGTYSFYLSSGDVDWFQINAAGNTTLTIRIEFQHSMGDLELEVYDHQSTMIDHSWGTSDSEQVMLNASVPATYYARIFGYQGATGNYSLILSGVDPLVAPDGMACAETEELTEESLAVGELAFRLNFDGNGPDYGAEILDASANEAGIGTLGDIWQLGPDPWMPAAGHSAPDAVVTVLGANYPDNRDGTLFIGPFDFSQAMTARLEFNLFYEIEIGFDGLIVTTTTDDGNTWHTLTPDQGYPGNAYAIGGPAFTGLSEAWQHVSVDLSAYLSPSTVLAFYFVSDLVVHAPGAAVDDITIRINGPSTAPIISPSESLTPPRAPEDLQPIDPYWLPKGSLFVAESYLNCREGNHVDFPILAQLTYGSSSPIKATNPERTWYYVLYPEKRLFCWVWHEGGKVEGDEEALSVLPNLQPEIEEGEEETRPGLPAYCLHREGATAAPECVPCFEGADPGTPCTP